MLKGYILLQTYLWAQNSVKDSRKQRYLQTLNQQGSGFETQAAQLTPTSLHSESNPSNDCHNQQDTRNQAHVEPLPAFGAEIRLDSAEHLP